MPSRRTKLHLAALVPSALRRTLLACAVLLVAGLVCCAFPAPCRAENDRFLDKVIPPLKIDAGAKVWFKIYTPQKMYQKQLAPWYSYFPYDPNVMSQPQGNLYPTWPQPYPPVTPGQDQKMPSADTSVGAAPANPQALPALHSLHAAPQLQPVSYHGMPGYGVSSYGAAPYGAPGYGAAEHGSPYGTPGYGAPAYGAANYSVPSYWYGR